MSETQDYTVKRDWKFQVTRGISYPALTCFVKEGLVPDSVTATIFCWNDDGSDETFSIGNGIQIVDRNIIWSLPKVEADRGAYKGVFKSSSDTFGTAILLTLEIQVV